MTLEKHIKQWEEQEHGPIQNVQGRDLQGQSSNIHPYNVGKPNLRHGQSAFPQYMQGQSSPSSPQQVPGLNLSSLHPADKMSYQHSPQGQSSKSHHVMEQQIFYPPDLSVVKQQSQLPMNMGNKGLISGYVPGQSSGNVLTNIGKC